MSHPRNRPEHSSHGLCAHPARNYSGVCPAGKLPKRNGRMIIKVREEEGFWFGVVFTCYIFDSSIWNTFLIYIEVKIKYSVLVYVTVNNRREE